MPSLDLYKKILGSPKTIGEAHKQESDNIMEWTWNNDIGAKKAYIYDYYHDDEPLLYYPVHPQKSRLKTPIDIKFIVNAYNSENKDQVGYHIQFKPSQKCPLNYYEKMFEKKYEASFPIALYIDIPDERGVYRKWLITETANWLGLQFPTYYVLPIDHIFQWVHKGTKYQMCGVGRSQNSYNSGTWVDYKIESVQNQRKCILPMNDISSTIFYDTRIIISAPIEEPVTWKCSKVEQVSPKGISHLTFAQDKYNPNTDYIEKNEDGDIIGMWADYFANDDVLPTELEDVPQRVYSRISYSGVKPDIKEGGNYKKFTVTFYDQDEVIDYRTGHWSFSIDGEDISERITTLSTEESKDVAENQIKAKLEADNNLIGKILVVGFESDDGIKSELEVNIIGR